MRTSALVLLALAVACQPAPKAETESMGGGSAAAAAPAGLSAEDEAAIRAVDQAWAKAATASDAAGIAALYTKDAVLLPPGEPAVHGDVEKYVTGMTTAVSGPFELKPTTVEGRGDLAYSVGEYTATLTPRKPGAKPMPTETGKYMEILKKQPDGSWKMIYDMWSPNAAPKP
jgi:uncharacterized protein (TIGR02246 family)